VLNEPELLLTKPRKSSGCVVVEARSNVSMTLDGLMAVFGGLCVLILLVVAWPVVMGLWPILVVALLHLLAVGWCFRNAWRSNWAKERFSIVNDQLLLEQFRAGQKSSSKWPMAWTRVLQEKGRFGDIHLILTSQGKRQEIGKFLPVGERERLAAMLEQALQPQTAWSSVKPIQVS
jgi:uncharacterized membrane protein